jgi:hypothetical protein
LVSGLRAVVGGEIPNSSIHPCPVETRRSQAGLHKVVAYGSVLQARVILVVVVVVVAILVAVLVVVPVVIVFQPAAVSVPVTRVILLSIMVRLDPSCAFIGRSSPIAVMPFIVVPDRIPITTDPCELRPWTWWDNADFAGMRRRTDSDTKRYLGVRCRCTGEKQDSKQRQCPDKTPNDVQFSFKALT